MSTKFNCMWCGCEFTITATKVGRKETKSSLDDAMVIAELCSEKVKELNKKNTQENRNKAKEIVNSMRNMLTDALTLPEGVSEGIIDSIEKNKIKRRKKA